MSGGRKQRNRLVSAHFLSALPTDRALRVLVSGTRDWDDPEPIRRQLARLAPGSTIIHGAARGVDRLAAEIARELNLGEIPCPANWKLGRGAGIIRNRAMLDEHQPEVVLAVHPCLEKAKGTRHMVEYALKKGVPVCLVGALNATGVSMPELLPPNQGEPAA